MWKPDVKASKWYIQASPFILLAAVLRFWDYGNIPYWNDELSALSRLNFKDFSSLIREGVQVDNHPALTHVFLWMWTGLFGVETWVVRLPFVLMSLGALLFVYRLSFHIFGIAAANMSLAILATSQTMLGYSIWVRPYAVGLLLCSLLAWVWYKLIFLQKNSIRDHLFFAVLISLSVYNHYFSGLLGMVIWFSGILYFRKLRLGYYVGSAVFALILFLPHLSITLAQFSRKGIGGWLRAPANDFAIEWLSSNFNYSIAAVILVIALAVFSGFIRFKNPDSNNYKVKLALVFLGWFASVFVIGFSYSRLVDPLLHHGNLLFASLFFNLGLGYFISSYHFLGKSAPWLLAGLMIFSMVVDRNHYEIMRKQPSAEIASHLGENNHKNALAIFDQNESYVDWYIKSDTLTFPVYNLTADSISIKEVLNLLISSDADIFFTDSRVHAVLLAAREKYQFVEISGGYTFDGLTFRNDSGSALPWSTLNEGLASLETSAEYVDLYQQNLSSAPFTFADELGIVVRMNEKPSDELSIVLEFRKGDALLHWTGGSYGEYGYQDKGQFKLGFQILLWDTFISRSEMDGVEMKIYLWNPQKSAVKIANWEVLKMNGNPLRYGFFGRQP